MVSFLRSNLAWMLLSLLISTGLWTFVTFTKNPEVTRPLNNIPIEIQNVPKAVVVQPETATVQVLVSAPSDVWDQLKPERLRAVIDATKVSSGVQDVPVKVTSSDPRVRVESWDPPRVFLKVEPLKTKTVPVDVVTSGAVPLGYDAGTPKVTPAQVAISGPESAVNEVQSVVVAVNLDGVTRSIDQTYRPIPQGVSGSDVGRVSLSPDTVLVQVGVDQKLAYKTLPVAAKPVGQVALGYQIVGITVDPETVTLVGDPQTLNQLTVVPTRPLDITGADGDRAFDADLALPGTVALYHSQSVVVRVLISPISGTKTLVVSPQVVNLGPNLSYTVNPGSVNLTVSGPVPILNRLQPSDVQATVDATGVSSGSQSLTVAAKNPDLVRVVSIQPQKVTLTIK